MADVRHIGFLKFNFLTAEAVKGIILQNFVKKVLEKIYSARDTGRRRPIQGLSRGIRDGWQPSHNLHQNQSSHCSDIAIL